MDEAMQASDFEPVPFYVGHHEQAREVAVTEEVFHHAEDLGVSQDFLQPPGHMLIPSLV